MLSPRLRFLSSAISRPAHAKYLRSYRRVHTLRPLPYPIEDGLGPFLPPEALKTIAVDYQGGLLQRLNDLAKGTPLENKSVAQTVIETAGTRRDALTFNYASLALNNSFFLDRLKPPPAAPAKNHQHEIQEDLYRAIVEEYGSLASFKSAFSAATTGLFTSGYVWFVTDKMGNIGVCPTFGPGSLLVGTRAYIANGGPNGDSEHMTHLKQDWQPEEDQEDISPAQSSTVRDPLPGVTSSLPTSGVSGVDHTKHNPLHSRSYHSTRIAQSKTSSAEYESLKGNLSDGGFFDDDLIYDVTGHKNGERMQKMATEEVTKGNMMHLGDNETLFPLFCVPVYEHAWLSAGFGVWGREEWMKHFWSVLDWHKVSEDYRGYVMTEAVEFSDDGDSAELLAEVMEADYEGIEEGDKSKESEFKVQH